ncbi:hypothetical protein GQ457_15G008680 [Hibiscus cannabinus]
MHAEAGPSLRRALLSAWSNLELGEIVAKQVIGMEKMDIGSYVLLSFIYSLKGKLGEGENIWKFVKDRGLPETSVSLHQRTTTYHMLMEMGYYWGFEILGMTTKWKIKLTEIHSQEKFQRKCLWKMATFCKHCSKFIHFSFIAHRPVRRNIYEVVLAYAVPL